MGSASVGAVVGLEGGPLTICARNVVASAGTAAIWKDYYTVHL
jgi:hypothetical protein